MIRSSLGGRISDRSPNAINRVPVPQPQISLNPRRPSLRLHQPFPSIQNTLPRRLLPKKDTEAGLDVFGLGQAMIDFGMMVSDDSLASLNLTKGCRRLINISERHQIQQTLGQSFDLRVGGSITNTLLALGQLSASDGASLKLGCTGCVGSDVLGVFYNSELTRQGIRTLDKEHDESLTGCVIVLTTPDAQRSFLVYPGNSEFILSEEMKKTIENSKILLIEGYLLGLPDTFHQIQNAIKIAKKNGNLVILTGGDKQVITDSLESFWKLISNGIDLFLCNHSESLALLGISKDSRITCKQAVEELTNYFSLVGVTDGPNGSYIGTKDQVHWIDVLEADEGPVDTCGAGDVYAAGLLYGFLLGFGIQEMGFIASRAASLIIQKTGTQLTRKEANQIIQEAKQRNRGVHQKSVFVDFQDGIKQEA